MPTVLMAELVARMAAGLVEAVAGLDALFCCEEVVGIVDVTAPSSKEDHEHIGQTRICRGRRGGL